MPSPKEKLAASLEALHDLQRRGHRRHQIRRPEPHRSRTFAGEWFPSGSHQGLVHPSRPGEVAGDSTTWYASFWDFCASYLSERFDKTWCLSPEQSLSFHGGNRTVPPQLIVRTPKGGNKLTALPHGTSFFDVRNVMPAESEVVERDGLRLYSVPAALVTWLKTSSGVLRRTCARRWRR